VARSLDETKGLRAIARWINRYSSGSAGQGHAAEAQSLPRFTRGSFHGGWLPWLNQPPGR
jgi:hypothetical protein